MRWMIVFVFLAGCAHAGEHDGGTHDMAVMFEGALFVAGAAEGVHECVGDVKTCGEIAGASVAITAVVGAAIYGMYQLEHHAAPPPHTHVDAPRRDGQQAIVIVTATPPKVGNTMAEVRRAATLVRGLGARGVDLPEVTDGEVCAVYARLGAPAIDDVDCAPAASWVTLAGGVPAR
jgi:hypothetical protein